jgi:hypothetical protein
MNKRLAYFVFSVAVSVAVITGNIYEYERLNESGEPIHSLARALVGLCALVIVVASLLLYIKTKSVIDKDDQDAGKS